MSVIGQAGKLAAKSAPKKPLAAQPAKVRRGPVAPVRAERVSAMGIIGIGLLSACVLGLSPPTFIILVIGMAPTVVSFLFETGGARRALPCMAALNIAGAAPVLNMLWGRSNSLSSAFALLSDPYIWLLMYGAAGAAFALLWVMPRLAQLWVDANAASDRAKLVLQQEQLVEEWGSEVAQHTITPGPKNPPG